ncbi:MAG TPA: substrate-binding domain-containing protein [Candidatus Limnocylindrales bacterium]
MATSWWGEAGHMDLEQPTLAYDIPAAGVGYMEDDAKADPQAQADQIDRFVADGASVIIVNPGVESAYLPAVQRAIKAGVPVIALFQPILHARTLYVAFDPVEQGRQEARALLAVKPRGTYAVIKGDPSTTPESDMIAAGIEEILQPAVDRGDVKIVASVDTHWWQADVAKQEMATILSQNGGSVDAVVVESDGMASGVAEAIEEAGLTGKVAVAAGGSYSSWDGLVNVLKGRQTVEVWGNLERTAHGIVEAAIALCRDPGITNVAGSVSVTWPGGDPMQAILLAPVAITKDNIGIVIQSGPTWRRWICGDATFTPDFAPPACQTGPVPTPSSSASGTVSG